MPLFSCFLLSLVLRFFGGVQDAPEVSAQQVAPAPGVRLPNPRPTTAYVLQAVVSVPGDYTGPVTLADLPTESFVLGHSRTQTYHQIAAWVRPGITGPLTIRQEAGPEFHVHIPKAVVDWSVREDGVYLEIDGIRFSLTGPASDVRAGRLYASGFRNLDLGPYGAAQVWRSARAGTFQLDFILNWHAGEDRQGDVLFNSARIVVAGNSTWIPFLPDPATGGGYLVKPMTAGQHIIPQRHERSFRFSVVPPGRTYVPPYFGVADSLYEFQVPSGVTASVGETQTWRDELRRNVPSSEVTGGSPVSPLWPAINSQYGGVTGGIDITPYPGGRWLVGASAAGFERYVIEQLRYRSRHRGCLYESDGAPVRWWQHLNNGAADWRMFNSVWALQGTEVLDGPFGPWPARLSGAYDPERYDPIDCQHAVREWNHNALLVEMTGDPLALHYLRMEAAKAVMTFWQGPGRASRSYQVLPGGGTSFGRAEAWACMLVSRAYIWSPGSRQFYEPWLRVNVDHLAAAQMSSGLFQVNPNAKEAKSWPFDGGDDVPDYQIGAGNEDIFIAAALGEVERALGDERIPGMIARHVDGMRRLGWAYSGPWSHSARSAVGGPRYASRDEWPASLAAAMATSPDDQGVGPYNDAWQVGGYLGVTRQLGVDASDLLVRYVGVASTQAALSSLRARAPRDFDQWWPVLGVTW